RVLVLAGVTIAVTNRLPAVALPTRRTPAVMVSTSAAERFSEPVGSPTVPRVTSRPPGAGGQGTMLPAPAPTCPVPTRAMGLPVKVAAPPVTAALLFRKLSAPPAVRFTAARPAATLLLTVRLPAVVETLTVPLVVATPTTPSTVPTV